MKTSLAFVVAVGAFGVGTAVTLAAPGQDRPGVIVPARVWVENRSRNDAIPVSLERSTLEMPLSVQIAGTMTVTTSAASLVNARAARQTWEYREITIPSGQSPLNQLTNAGGDGWETTGLTLPASGGMLVILKRPRQ